MFYNNSIQSDLREFPHAGDLMQLNADQFMLRIENNFLGAAEDTRDN